MQASCFFFVSFVPSCEQKLPSQPIFMPRGAPSAGHGYLWLNKFDAVSPAVFAIDPNLFFCFLELPPQSSHRQSLIGRFLAEEPGTTSIRQIPTWNPSSSSQASSPF